MAVLANNSDGCSVPAEIVENLEMDDDYNKYAPSADYNSTGGRNIFRNKKLTKKRHESKTRRTDQGSTNVCCSDEDEHQVRPSTSRQHSIELSQAQQQQQNQPRSIPKMVMSINQTIQKMTLKDTHPSRSGGASSPVAGPSGVTYPIKISKVDANVPDSTDIPSGSGGDVEGIGATSSTTMADIDGDMITSGQCDHPHQDPQYLHPQNQANQQSHCTGNNSSSCNLPTHAQGKRRRHRRKQQYKRMAVDVQSDKKCRQLKVPTSNSSEDSGIGKRKRNIVVADGNTATSSGQSGATGDVMFSKGPPVSAVASTSGTQRHSPHFMQFPNHHTSEDHWQLEPDSDAVMMDCDDVESSSVRVDGGLNNSQGILVTEEESGESDTQNDDVESLSDHNQDADDEESDYYNNDSSTTSLSESSFTILNPTNKKFIPVHSREIRSGRRRLKNPTFSTVENEELSRFLQNPVESVIQVSPATEKERQDFINVASLYSLSYEECHEQEEQRVWVKLTKTSKTSTATQQQRRSDLLKAAAAAGDRSSFPEASVIPVSTILGSIFDSAFEKSGGVPGGGDEGAGNYQDDDEQMSPRVGLRATSTRSGVAPGQLVNSKRIKKGC